MIARKKILLLGDINSIHFQKWILGLKEDFELTIFSLDPLEVQSESLKNITIHTNESKTTNSLSKLAYLKSIRKYRRLHKKLNSIR